MVFQEGSELKKIEESAFYGCGNLKIVGAPPSLKVIGKDAFGETPLEGEFWMCEFVLIMYALQI